MVNIETLQGFLDDAWDIAPEGAATLREQLRKYETQASRLFSAGTLNSVQKNSASQTYAGPGHGIFTIVQIQWAWRHLINLYDRMATDLASADEALIVAAMRAKLASPVTEFESDFSTAGASR